MTELIPVDQLPAIRAQVHRRFPVYDAQWSENAVYFYVSVDKASLEENFTKLKDELKASDLLPILRYHGGEYQIFVLRRPELVAKKNTVNVILFIATWVTTFLSGVLANFLYEHSNEDFSKTTTEELVALLFSQANMLEGLAFFALPLMLILILHELGHYYTAKKHGVAATWPYFIPFPPALGGALNIGTMGAFISMREPIPDRKALFDIGASGPLVGFAVALPVTFLGLYLTALDPAYLPELNPALSGITLGTPLIYEILATPFSFAPNQIIHPMAFAGWVGLFVTGINLLPAGQLDGGHVAASYFGERSRWLSFAAVAMLIIFGFGFPAIDGLLPEIPPYTGWLLFALIITFLGIEHPPTLNNLSTLDTKRKIAAAFVLLVFVLTFTPTPVQP